MKKIIISSIFGLIILLPSYSLAALDYSRLVKCDGVVTEGEDSRQNPCDFAALIDMVNSTINWLFLITIPVVTVLFAWSGLLYMSGKEANIKKARAMFTAVGIGFIIMLVAWAGVYTLVSWFAEEDSGAKSFLEKNSSRQMLDAPSGYGKQYENVI